MQRSGAVPPKEASKAIVDARLARRLWPFIRPHQRLIWIGLALLLGYSACRLTLPWLVKLMIDRNLIAGEMGGFGVLLGAFCGVAAVESLVRRRQMWVVDLAGQNALYDLRVRLFQHLQRLSSRFYDKTPTGGLVGRVTTDVEALQEVFSTGVVTILGDLVFLLATVILLFTMSWPLTLVTLLMVPVLLAVTLYVRGKVRAAYETLRSRLGRLHGHLHEHVSGMAVVQAFGVQERSREEFREIDAQWRDASLRGVTWESILSAGAEMVGSFTMALILWFGGRQALSALGLDPGPLEGWASGITLGTLFAFIEYMQRFFQPLNDLTQKVAVLQNAMTASQRIFDLLDQEETTPEPREPVQAPPARGTIEFRGVRFGYREGPVLRGVDFRVEPGERVAIVGSTGAGKTTLLKLLTRLYDVDEGAILLDGIDIRDYALKDLRRRVGIVPQDTFLFEGNVLENVRLCQPQTSDEEAIRVADELHLDEVVRRFPRGYYAPVRERGKNLSSGEKQLIAFARVLLDAPPVLALDEATSNVDSHTEHLLQEAVHLLMQGRTALIIAHRLSTIRDVDRILVLHKGELVEEGTHDELFAKRGVYWRLYQLQYKEQESAEAV